MGITEENAMGIGGVLARRIRLLVGQECQALVWLDLKITSIKIEWMRPIEVTLRT
jgi:hypothetical protein